jgi:hypothetical protein
MSKLAALHSAENAQALQYGRTDCDATILIAVPMPVPKTGQVEKNLKKIEVFF